jgi:hypothetical protein
MKASLGEQTGAERHNLLRSSDITHCPQESGGFWEMIMRNRYPTAAYTGDGQFSVVEMCLRSPLSNIIRMANERSPNT